MMERLEIWATSDCMVSNYEYLPEKDVNPCAWNVLVLNYMSGPPHAALECFHRMHLLKFEPSLLLHSNMEQILPSSNWKGSQATHKKNRKVHRQAHLFKTILCGVREFVG